MSESIKHQELVGKIVEYVKSSVSLENISMIKADYMNFDRPNLAYDRFIPDVQYCYYGKLFIGEAKTLDDFDRPHSKAQFQSYMHECEMFSGKATIIVAVPWELSISAKNHLNYLKSKLSKDIEVVVLTDLD